MEAQSQNPDDISRNPPLRRYLDHIEAESELTHQMDPQKYQKIFSEAARTDRERLVLQVTDPEKYQQLLDLVDLRWAQSWQELARFKPSELKISLSPDSRYQAALLCMRSEANRKIVLETPPALEILLESPAVKDDFFRAFNITTVNTVLNWCSLLSDDQKQRQGDELEGVALQVGATHAAHVSGRLLIIPDSVDLSSGETFIELAKQYIIQKTSPEFFEGCNLTVYNGEQWYQERLSQMGFGEWLAHKALDVVAYPIFAALINREEHSADRESRKTLKIEILNEFPILREFDRKWSREMVNPGSPVDAPIREYLILDPDCV